MGVLAVQTDFKSDFVLIVPISYLPSYLLLSLAAGLALALALALALVAPALCGALAGLFFLPQLVGGLLCCHLCRSPGLLNCYLCRLPCSLHLLGPPSNLRCDLLDNLGVVLTDSEDDRGVAILGCLFNICIEHLRKESFWHTRHLHSSSV